MAKRHLHHLAGYSHVRAYNRLPVEGRMYFSGDENEDLVMCKMCRSADKADGDATLTASLAAGAPRRWRRLLRAVHQLPIRPGAASND
jgi:hypothetical protein